MDLKMNPKSGSTNLKIFPEECTRVGEFADDYVEFAARHTGTILDRHGKIQLAPLAPYFSAERQTVEPSNDLYGDSWPLRYGKPVPA